MRKIAITISKGGVGKTTSTVSIASGFARIGKKVLIIDTDPQGQILTSLGLKNDIGLADLILDEKDFLECAKEVRENLLVLGGGEKIAKLQREIARKDFGGEVTLKEAISPYEDKFDYVFIDTPPSLSPILVNVFFYATELLVPASLQVLTLQSMVEYHKTLDSIQKYNKDTQIKYIVPTMFDRRTKQSHEIYKQLNQYYGQLVTNDIPLSVRLSECPGHGKTIWEYDGTSKGAVAYANLIKRILKDG